MSLNTTDSAGLIKRPRHDKPMKEDTMPKVKIKRSVLVGGKHLEAGETYNLSDDDAKVLIGMGKAEEFKPKEKGKNEEKEK